MKFSDKERQLELIREKYFSDRKVICTGNPDSPYTIAHGIRKLYPDTTFIHRSSGWDLEDVNDRLIEEFKRHNTFINASYIAPGVQSRLLEICNLNSKFYDVINIGSTHEYDGLGTEDYTRSKIDLREKGLSLNTFRFKTCHLILGLIRSHDGEFDGEPLEVDQIAEMIKWILDNKHGIPLTTLDSKKRPW